MKPGFWRGWSSPSSPAPKRRPSLAAADRPATRGAGRTRTTRAPRRSGRGCPRGATPPMDGEGSRVGVAGAGLALEEVLRLVDLALVLVPGLVVDQVAGLLDGVVDLVVVLVGEVLGLVHRVVEETHSEPSCYVRPR